MTTADILDRWLKYSQYDEKKRFNLLSPTYAMHKATEQMKTITSFDPTGTIAVLYAKQIFFDICDEMRVKLLDILSKPEEWAEDLEMYKLFTSDEFAVVENAMLDSIDRFVRSVVPAKMIGERDVEAERKFLFDSIVFVVEELTKLHAECFLKGDTLAPVSKIGTKILVYNRLSECLADLEKSPDGMYLCYISEFGTVSGYFGFFMKSNGTILSINERKDEAFPGQHAGGRNVREVVRSKQTGLFPYEIIEPSGEKDYLGYSKGLDIDEEKLDLFALGAESYMPIILAIVLLSNKYAGADISGIPLKLIDTLLLANTKNTIHGAQSLVPVSGTSIATINAEYHNDLTTETVISGALHERFSGRGKSPEAIHNGETGEFSTKEHDDFYGDNDAELFIKLYGEGFELDTTKLLVNNPHLRQLGAPTEHDMKFAKPNETDYHAGKILPDPEYIGTAGRMDLLAYKQAREQLAEYIKDRIFEEYVRFGSGNHVNDWYMAEILKQRDKIFDLCKKRWNAEQAEDKLDPTDILSRFKIIKGTGNGRYADDWGGYYSAIKPFNATTGGNYNPVYLCPITGNKASIFFGFTPYTYHDLEAIVGEGNLPKILIGWRKNGHSGYGNSLLWITDAVTEVGTPFEDREVMWNPRYKNLKRDNSYRFYGDCTEEVLKPLEATFTFIIGFSKRGLQRLVEEKIKP